MTVSDLYAGEDGFVAFAPFDMGAINGFCRDGRPKKYTPQQIRLDLLEQGWTNRQIAEMTEITLIKAKR